MQTATEILEAINKLPADQQAELHKGLLPIVKTNADTLGVIVRTTDEDKTYGDNLVKLKANQIAEENFNKKFKEKFDELDAEILKITGVEKKPMQANAQNEKTSEYMKRALTEAASKGQSADARMVRELQAKMAENETTYKTELGKLKGENFDFRINTAFESEVMTRSIAVPANITDPKEKEEYVSTARESLRLQFRNKYTPKETDQGIVYHKGEHPQLGNDGKPLPLKNIIDAEFKGWFIPMTNNQGGSGGPTPGGGGGGKFATIKDIHAYLAKEGKDAKTPVYQQEFNKLVKESGLTV